MARDIYGELLSRALSRGAPQGHFAAYITPQEGGALRSMGGGVPPGGGQYMANGIPSFQGESGDYDSSTGDYGAPDATGSTGSGAGSGASGGGDDDSFSAPSGALGGLDVTGVGAVSAAQAAPHGGLEGAISQAAQAATQAATQAEFGVPTELGTPFGWDERGNYVGYTDDAFTGRDRTSGLPGTPNANPATDSFGRQPGNIDAYGFVTAQGARNAQNNQSQGGLGSMSPGAMSIEAGMTFDDLAAINSLGRDGGYSVNSTNPDAHDLEVSFLNARYNPQFANAVFGIGGLVSPTFMMGVNAINSLSPHAQYAGYESPGFGNMLGVGNMLGQAARGIGLGGVVDAIGDVRSGIGDAIGNVGTQLGNALSPVGDFFSGQPPAVEGPSAPQDGGSQEIAFVPNIAPLNEVAAPGEGPFVSGDTETQSANIPPEILARILANEQSGRERVGLA